MSGWQRKLRGSRHIDSLEKGTAHLNMPLGTVDAIWHGPSGIDHQIQGTSND